MRPRWDAPRESGAGRSSMRGELMGTDEVAGAGRPAAGIPVRGTAIVAIGLVSSQLLSMGQMLAVSRLLGPVEFGAFGAVSVVVLLGTTAMVATQAVVARHVAGSGGHPVGSRPVLAVGAATTALTLLVTPAILWLTHLSGPLGLVLAALAFLPLTVTGAQLGQLQGFERHRQLAVLYLVATGARVGGAVLGAAWARTATATMLGLLIGCLVAALAGRVIVSGPQPTPERQPLATYLREVGHAGHALLALYLLTNFDLLLARSQLSPHDAGLYAAGSLVTRAAFFLPQAVLVAAFPRMVAGSRLAHRQAVAAVTILGLGTCLVVGIMPGLVIGFVAGAQYQAVAPSLWLFALAGAGYSVVQVQLYARLARHAGGATLLLWGALVGLVVAVWLAGGTVDAIIGWACATAWTSVVVGILFDAEPRRLVRRSPART